MTKYEDFDKIGLGGTDITTWPSGVGDISHNATVTLTNESANDGAVNRPLAGDGDFSQGFSPSTVIYCAPDSGAGSNTGAGTQADPATLERAAELTPYLGNNILAWDLYTVPNSNGNLPASYDQIGDGWFHGSPLLNNQAAEFRIIGNESNPSDVQIEDVGHFGGGGSGKFDHHLLAGVQFNSALQLCKESLVRNCNIYNRTNGTKNNLDTCISSKGARSRITKCTVGEGNVSYAFRAISNIDFMVDQTTVDYTTDVTFASGEIKFTTTCTNAHIATDFVNMTDGEVEAEFNTQNFLDIACGGVSQHRVDGAGNWTHW